MVELSVALLSMEKHTKKERGMGWGHRSAKMLDFPKVSSASSRQGTSNANAQIQSGYPPPPKDRKEI